MKNFLLLIRKDLSMFILKTGAMYSGFAILLGLITIFKFADDIDSESREFVAITLLITFFLTALFLVALSFEWEKENDVYQYYKVLNIDMNLFFISKSIAIATAFTVIWAISTLLHMLLFQPIVIESNSVTTLAKILGIGIIQSLGFAFVSVTVMNIALASRLRYMILFILTIPLMIPLIINSGICLRALFSNTAINQGALLFLVATCLIYFSLGLILFKIAMEE